MPTVAKQPTEQQPTAGGSEPTKENGSNKPTDSAQGAPPTEATLLEKMVTLLGESQPDRTRQGTPQDPIFKVGWDLRTFLRRNGMTLTEESQKLHLTMSRAASKEQVERMHRNSQAGFRTTVKQTAVWNKKAKSWDLAETARVVTPDCKDPELIETAFVKFQARQTKDLAEKRQAGIEQGARLQ